MIADLKPYPEYKESGLPWLGQVPGHWETRASQIRLRDMRDQEADVPDLDPHAASSTRNGVL